MTDGAEWSDAIAALETHFHALIRRVVTSMVGVAQPDALPRLERELHNAEPMWFPVPGMYGGFSWTMHHEPQGPVLIVESWSRVVGGSGQRHRITEDGSVLVADGFV